MRIIIGLLRFNISLKDFEFADSKKVDLNALKVSCKKQKGIFTVGRIAASSLLKDNFVSCTLTSCLNFLTSLRKIKISK